MVRILKALDIKCIFFDLSYASDFYQNLISLCKTTLFIGALTIERTGEVGFFVGQFLCLLVNNARRSFLL